MERALKTRVILGLVAVAYAGSIALGSFIHRLGHHFDEHQHAHSLPCLASGLTEAAADESLRSSHLPAIGVGDCAIKLILDELSRPTVSNDYQPQIHDLVIFINPEPLPPPIIWAKEILVSSISPRGPPANS